MKRLISLVSAFLFAGSALAATTPNSIITAQTPSNGKVQFLQGTDTAGTYKTLYTGGANGSKCVGIWEVNDDGSATHLVTLAIFAGGINFGGAAVTTASNDGYANAVPAKNMMASAIWPGLPLDGNGNPYILLKSGDTLQATFATSLTASTYINLVAVCVDF